MLSLKQLDHVCLLYSGGSKQCRYLKQDDNDYDKWYCVKKRKSDRDKIDAKSNEFLQECASKGIDPTVGNMPLGDNCSGYPMLKHIEQGYDVK